MILKNWHEFKNKLIVEVNDSFITSDGKKLDVIGIFLDEETLKVFFSLPGGKKVNEETLYKNIKSKKYKHKSHRGFFSKLFGRGDMYQNQSEAKNFLINKIQNEHPEQYKHYSKAMEEIELDESTYNERESREESSFANETNKTGEEQTEKSKDVVVDGAIKIRHYESSAFGEGYIPVWGVECGNCGHVNGTFIGNLGSHANTYGDGEHRKVCDQCKATNLYYPRNTHWSVTKFGKHYSG